MSDLGAAPGRWACRGANAEGDRDRPRDHRPIPAPPGPKVRLKDRDPGWAQTEELKELDKGEVRRVRRPSWRRTSRAWPRRRICSGPTTPTASWSCSRRRTGEEERPPAAGESEVRRGECEGPADDDPHPPPAEGAGRRGCQHGLGLIPRARPPPPVDGCRTGEQDRGDQRPAVPGVEQQVDVAPKPDCRARRAVVVAQQGYAVLRAERDTGAHGLIPEGRRSTVPPPASGPPSLASSTPIPSHRLPAARCSTPRRTIRSTKYPTDRCGRFACTRFSLDYPQGAH
jgi:hypothetical protein